MNLDHQIMQQLKNLRLSGVLESLELRLQQAQAASMGYIDFFQLIIQDEIERREAKKLQMRLRRAAFEEEKTVECFDFSFNPKINTRLINDLATCIFIKKTEHILLYGPAGTGNYRKFLLMERNKHNLPILIEIYFYFLP